jgi:hypothetical protein
MKTLPCVLLCISFAFACGRKGATFKGDTTKAVLNPKDFDVVVKPKDFFTYELLAAEGAPVVRAGVVDLNPRIRRNNTDEGLSGDELKEWKVILSGDSKVQLDAHLQDLDIKAVAVDLSQVEGMVRFTADFDNRKLNEKGKSTRQFFVDGIPPRTLLFTLDQGGSNERVMTWGISDNYGINQEKTQLVACHESLSKFDVTSAQALQSLPEKCTVVMSGKDFHKQEETLSIANVKLAQGELPGTEFNFLLYVEDKVGLVHASWNSEPPKTQAQIILSGTPTELTYSTDGKLKFPVNVVYTKDGVTRNLKDLTDPALLAKFKVRVKVTHGDGTSTEQIIPYSSPLEIVLGASGFKDVVASVENDDLGAKSNSAQFLSLVDITPPHISGPVISVPGGVLNPSSQVSIQWTSSDANGISKQKLEVQTGNGEWQELAMVKASQGSYEFPWADRAVGKFAVRVSAQDSAGNESIAVRKWVPQIFNAGMLTTSVRCFFCHLEIRGDAAGINFGNDINTDSGSNFLVTGKFFSTNFIPEALTNKPSLGDLLVGIKGGKREFYTNDELKIFPKDNMFPLLKVEDLKKKMTGFLRLKKAGNESEIISRVYDGDLILDGTKPGKPIELSGEVLVTGNLIIKGKYTGIGTIYAKNIFVPADLTAHLSEGQKVFPFSEDENTAKIEAKAAIDAKLPALYLGATDYLVVGDYDSWRRDVRVDSLEDSKVNVWLNKLGVNAYKDLGSRPSAFKIGNSEVKFTRWNPATTLEATLLSNISTFKKNADCAEQTTVLQPDWDNDESRIDDPTSDCRSEVEVSRVDAYLYSGKKLQWRAFNAINLNGGFMAPEADILSSIPAKIGRAFYLSNPTSFTYPAVSKAQFFEWLVSKQAADPLFEPRRNMIRYDYRLRVGGSGFETLKESFADLD